MVGFGSFNDLLKPSVSNAVDIDGAEKEAVLGPCVLNMTVNCLMMVAAKVSGTSCE